MIAPLPLRVRIVPDETLRSYARRLAQRNFSTVRDIEGGLIASQAIRLSKSWRSPERAQVWRELGGLGPRTFLETRDLVSDTMPLLLCTRCARGANAYGIPRGRGMVCLKHRRWIGERQQSIADRPQIITAERRYRAVLVRRGAGLGTEIFELSKQCTHIARAELEEAEPGLAPSSYASSVAIAITLSTPEARRLREAPVLRSSDFVDFALPRIGPIFPGITATQELRIQDLLLRLLPSSRLRRANLAIPAWSPG